MAANAAKNFIDMCEDGSLPHQLLTGSDEENAKGKTYKRVFIEAWNSELIDAEFPGANKRITFIYWNKDLLRTEMFPEWACHQLCHSVPGRRLCHGKRALSDYRL